MGTAEGVKDWLVACDRSARGSAMLEFQGFLMASVLMSVARSRRTRAIRNAMCFIG